MTKKEQLIETFILAEEFNNEFIAVAIETRGSSDIEIIINPRSNFKDKLEYYKKSYTDDLVLNSYDGIRITSAVSFDSDSEIGYVKDYLLEGEF